jgi:hypothetical protein
MSDAETIILAVALWFVGLGLYSWYYRRKYKNDNNTRDPGPGTRNNKNPKR